MGCMRDCIRGPACEECVDDYGHEPYCNYGWGRCHSPRIEYAGCDDEHGNVLRVGFYKSVDEPMVDSLEGQSALMKMSKRHGENRAKGNKKNMRVMQKTLRKHDMKTSSKEKPRSRPKKMKKRKTSLNTWKTLKKLKDLLKPTAVRYELFIESIPSKTLEILK